MTALRQVHDPPWLYSASYPHLLDRIVDFLPLPALATLRLVSRGLHERANAILYAHICFSFSVYATTQVVDPFERRRIPGLVLDAKDPAAFKLSLSRIVAHTRVIDHHMAHSWHSPPEWVPAMRISLPDSILHRVDVSPNQFDRFPLLAVDATNIALSYRMRFDRIMHLDLPFLERLYAAKKVIAHLAIPPDLDLSKHSRESVWKKARDCDHYFAEVDEVTFIVTQGSGAPPRWSSPDASDTGALFDAFMAALCRLGCERVVLSGLETLDPGLLSFELDRDVASEDRLALYKGVMDDWVEAAPDDVRDEAPKIEVISVEQLRRERGLDDYRWAVMTAGVGPRLPMPPSWAAASIAI
ncbi:uncharacterized protein LOC62_07G008958 [Vanrija pseudolonga]|uniref:F-box domain-containing protein n=1 Tax=Vanrija pseudolonga TaxID=143232 RepID=A0AAF0YHU9_9TREE|nr:hypothetical protein LOC62_07G008958 [Vanrija pseudolonga]